MKIVIPGGSGQVGKVLSRAFHAAGHEVVVLSRHPNTEAWRVVPWDGQRRGEWFAEFDGAEAVINLAGHTVNCRYTAKSKRVIMDSRLNSTRLIGEAISSADRPPRTWLQASTATIYAHRYDAPQDEATGILGGSEPGAPAKWNFSVEVATAWERTLDEAIVPATRKVKMRSALIMSPHRGGIFDTLLRLVRAGLGGQQGDGQQFVSWVHYEDFIRAVWWLLEHSDLAGVVNIASPNPLPNRLFMRALRDAWGMPIGLPATTWMLEIGALLFATESELVLKSRRVVPSRLGQAGFSFRFPDWGVAARQLCAEWKGMASA